LAQASYDAGTRKLNYNSSSPKWSEDPPPPASPAGNAGWSLKLDGSKNLANLSRF
jgi:hypothetical protein